MQPYISVRMIHCHTATCPHRKLIPIRLILYIHTILHHLAHKGASESFVPHHIHLKALITAKDHVATQGVQSRAPDAVLQLFLPPLADDGVVGLHVVFT